MTEKRYSIQEVSNLDADEKEDFLNLIEADCRKVEELYWGCSQVVTDTLQRNLSIGNKEVFMAATGFAGGVAGNREICGALLGGIMAIGVVYGRSQFEPGKVAHEQQGFLETRERASMLCDKFRDQFGSLKCADVRQVVGRIPLGDENHLYTLEGVKNHSKCGDVTGITARLTAEIMFAPSEDFPLDIETRIRDLNRVREQQKKNTGD
jgi:C_GCAxxG_C_C family probable redox protein